MIEWRSEMCQESRRKKPWVKKNGENKKNIKTRLENRTNDMLRNRFDT